MKLDLKVKYIGRQDYQKVCEAMQEFTAERTETTQDEIWFVEHPPVFTQGRHGKAEHILNPHNIPIVQTDRGGQVTYHGPGQAVVYFLIDLKRQKQGIKDLVCKIEKSTIKLLKNYGVEAHLIDNAPGVYVEDKKVASLGLRVKQGKTYHGLSINVDMDLTPFSYINPCGYQNLKMCQIKDFKPNVTLNEVYEDYCRIFSE